MMHRMTMPLILLVAICAGCSWLQLSPPESFGDRLLYAAASTTAAYDSIAEKTRAREITPDEADGLIAIVDRASASIEAARRVAAAGDEVEGDRRLALARAILTEITRYGAEEN